MVLTLVLGIPALVQTGTFAQTDPVPDPTLSDPAVPAPVLPDPAPVEPVVPLVEPPAPPEVLRLTARPGTFAEYVVSSQRKSELIELKLEVRPGRILKAADRIAANMKLKNQRIETLASMKANDMPQKDKYFIRVQPSKNGNTIVLNTSVYNLADPSKPGKMNVIRSSLIITFEPAGKIINAVFTSSDPQLQKAYHEMDVKTFIREIEATDGGWQYGQPLVVGKSVTLKSNTPMQEVAKAIIDMNGLDKRIRIESSEPWVTYSKVEYNGKDVQENLNFRKTLSMDPLFAKLGFENQKMIIKTFNVSGSGKSIVRSDGLLLKSTFVQSMNTQALVDRPNEPYRLLFKWKLIDSTSTTLKNITLP
jgi:hypothetical protein